MMSTSKSTARRAAPRAQRKRTSAEPIKIDTYTDDTAPQILAFLVSMECLFDEGQVYEGFHRGRSLIERIAMSAKGTDSPRIRLSNEECADVLHFLAQVQPRDKRNWWIDPEDAPSPVTGLQFVLFALKESLRGE
jgi:hypothetical protein